MQYMHIMHTCMLTYMHMSMQNNTNLVHAYQVTTTRMVRVMIFWCNNTRRTGGAQTCCASSPRKKQTQHMTIPLMPRQSSRPMDLKH